MKVNVTSIQAIFAKLSTDDLNFSFHLQRIHWACSEEDRRSCDLKGKGAEDCQNSIRVLSAVTASRLLVCGTNCYRPLCRHYLLDGAGRYQVVPQID